MCIEQIGIEFGTNPISSQLGLLFSVWLFRKEEAKNRSARPDSILNKSVPPIFYYIYKFIVQKSVRQCCYTRYNTATAASGGGPCVRD